MLFLGAGASSAVGIPALAGLTASIISRLEAEGYGELIHHITETLERANQGSRFFNQGEIDIEVIFSVLNGRIDPETALMELGPFAIYLNALGGNRNLPFEDKLRNEQDIVEIQRIVGEVIRTNCMSPNMDRALDYYTQLFEFKKRILGRTNRSNQLFNHIVTTNYDLVIERCALKNSDIPRKGGFEQEPRTDEYYLPLRKILLDEQHANYKINILKLHGSIDWRIRDSDRHVVRRYDQSINNAFADALRNKPDSRIIIANGNRNNIQGRIDQYFPANRRHFIDIPFGNDGFISEL